jgi:hypothetical protein
MTFILRLKRAWAVLTERDPPAHTIDKDMKMALADDILALFPTFQAAVAAKDTEITTLTTEVSDLKTQVAAAEAAVATVKGEISPAAPAAIDPNTGLPV